MSIESFIHAMPKVDLHIQFEGAISRELIMLIVEQTDVASLYKKHKQYEEWLALLHEPDFARLDEIARETAGWIRHPEDLARAVYELGVSLSKQNIKYAEVSIIPAIYTDIGLTFQEFLDAINDGRDRAARAWQVRMDWILAMPRDRPRKSDDIARWATSATSQKGHVVGLSLVGREEVQPIAQFKKAFNTAEKKDLARISHIHTHGEADGFADVLEVVKPQRVTDAWNVLGDGAFLSAIVEQDIPLVVSPMREVCLGRLDQAIAYPLHDLLDNQVNIVLGSGMPTFYGATLDDTYRIAAEQNALTLDDIQLMLMNSVRASLLPKEEKQALLEEFQQAWLQLQDEHLVEEA